MPQDGNDAMHSRASWSGTAANDDAAAPAQERGSSSVASGSMELVAELSGLEDALSPVRAELVARGCPLAVQKKVYVALEELFVNVCNYAYAAAGAPGRVRVDYAYSDNPDTITVSITDWGAPFDPLAHADPTAPASAAQAKIGGLGILMVKRCTDGLGYLRDGDANVVTFRKAW